jgi:two-component system chemotaxis sensor kinase CheA
MRTEVAHRTESESLLVVCGRGRRLAVALAEVVRLEEFSATSFQRAGAREVFPYRDGLLPLIRLGDGLSDRVTVVVHAGCGRDLGLLVDGLIDVFDLDGSLDRSTATVGVHGSAVMFGRVTDVIDVAALARSAGLFDDAAPC